MHEQLAASVADGMQRIMLPHAMTRDAIKSSQTFRVSPSQNATPGDCPLHSADIG
jgi:hypothetical protein